MPHFNHFLFHFVLFSGCHFREGGKESGKWFVSSSNCCVFRSPGALTFRYGCTVHVGADVGAGGVKVDVIYIIFIISVEYTGYLVPYKDKVQMDNRTTGQQDNVY